MNSKTLASLGILLVAIATGALHDFLAVNLNYQLHHVEHHSAFSFAHSKFQAWVHGWGARELRWLKWSLAAGFIAINLVLAIGLARIRFGHHRYRTPLIIGFAAVAVCALIAQFLASSIGGMGTLSIKLLHALQYPVVLLLIWAASWSGGTSR